MRVTRLSSQKRYTASPINTVERTMITTNSFDSIILLSVFVKQRIIHFVSGLNRISGFTNDDLRMTIYDFGLPFSIFYFLKTIYK
jgi:hypothetical protein